MYSSGPRRPRPSGWGWSHLLRDLVATWRLLFDPRVPGLLKLALPVLALVYMVSPLDLLPLLPFDDIAIALLAARLFVALAPKESVNRAFGGQPVELPPAPRREEGEVIDTTWRVIE